ncbi:MAG: magnesium/cobalt transporter CorA [Myxococcota bacterium]
MSDFPIHRPAAGARPGALAIPPGSPPPVVRLMQYDEAGLEEREVADLDELVPYANTETTTWIDVQGLGDERKLLRIAEIFGLHPLAISDAVNVPQRAGIESYPDQLLVVARAPWRTVDGATRVPQVCLLVGRGYVLSFQERYFGFFDAVRERIRRGGGPIRRSGPCYLAYALVDALVDHYFPVVDELADALDELEEEVLADPTPALIARVHRLQRRVLVLRRVARPMTEMVARLAIEPSPFVTESTRLYLRDTRDQAQQVLGRLESTREASLDLMNAALATLGHRQNEVMKLLTLVGSIFIPLTFIAGIYGMNFEHMPELHARRGYFVVLGVMAAVAIAMLGYFRRRGWLGRRSRRRR